MSYVYSQLTVQDIRKLSDQFKKFLQILYTSICLLNNKTGLWVHFALPFSPPKSSSLAHFHFRCYMCIKGECLWRKLRFRCAPCGVHFLSKPISDKTCYLSYFSVIKNLMQNCCSWAIVCKVWGAQDLVYELSLQQCWVKVWGPVRTLQITNTATWSFSNLIYDSLEMYL